MAKPILLTVDDDAEVLRAVERDLRREYGNRFRVLRANSGESALDALRQLKLRNDPASPGASWSCPAPSGWPGLESITARR